MKVLISGASGLIGSNLCAALADHGFDVIRLVRRRSDTGPDAVYWNPVENTIDTERLDDLEAVIHLAGENIAAGRWTNERRRRIRQSRVATTQLLARTLATLVQPPRVFLSASATGFYGDRADDVLTEDSPPGEGFLADVCQEWEAATQPARDAGIRVVNLRLGMVLTPRGGALRQMLPAFRLCAGGRLGNGRQYISWISLPDLVGVVLLILNEPSLSGPVNAVAPEPVTNREFTHALAQALSRPAPWWIPGWLLRLMAGPMADELLLASTRVEPRKLLETGVHFKHPDIQTALVSLLDEPS